MIYYWKLGRNHGKLTAFVIFILLMEKNKTNMASKIKQEKNSSFYIMRI